MKPLSQLFCCLFNMNTIGTFGNSSILMLFCLQYSFKIMGLGHIKKFKCRLKQTKLTRRRVSTLKKQLFQVAFKTPMKFIARTQRFEKIRNVRNKQL